MATFCRSQSSLVDTSVNPRPYTHDSDGLLTKNVYIHTHTTTQLPEGGDAPTYY